ncbi:hypothetical protein [Niabella soli]|uniref:Uncharacterized protein n=1 Tax=Niabella soli DSM 19437 TaxID=929713 RepID=W0F847_9BACT|nr:hypothetical protein [Niabella soli]AHF17546.1 hypothetical protein NIASO_09645 [Niabella soli DSM 19437]
MKNDNVAIPFLFVFLALWVCTGCQKNKDAAPGSYQLITIYENPLPDPVTIQFINGSITPKGDTLIRYEFDKIMIDPNSSTQIMQDVCLKDCPDKKTMVEPNMAKITIGNRQRTDVDYNVVPLNNAAAHTDSINIFNKLHWSVSRMNTGQVIKIYKIIQGEYFNTK